MDIALTHWDNSAAYAQEETPNVYPVSLIKQFTVEWYQLPYQDSNVTVVFVEQQVYWPCSQNAQNPR